MNPLDVRLAKLAVGQHSVVARQQALSLGMTPRQIDRRVDVGGLVIIRFKELVTIAGLWHIVDTAGAQGRGGSGVLRQLLLARDPALAPTESALEDAICGVLRRFDLPEPARQHPIVRPGRKSLRLDIAYPEALLDIEGDGERWHTSTRDFQRDRERTNDLVAHGWGILCFTWHDVRRRPAELAAQVEAVRSTRLQAVG
ncbi:MAG TPA: hypothetical protein VF711_03590 [Acidimicrobiales bacterium]|jgi:very-short-patch-repair endonuclease